MRERLRGSDRRARAAQPIPIESEIRHPRDVFRSELGQSACSRAGNIKAVPARIAHAHVAEGDPISAYADEAALLQLPPARIQFCQTIEHDPLPRSPIVSKLDRSGLAHGACSGKSARIDLLARLAHAAFRDQSAHEPPRRDVETIIGRAAFLRRHAHLDVPPVRPAVGMFHFFRAALFDRDLRQPVAHLPIERRRRQRDVKRHAVILRRQRLQIGADLVRNIAGERGAVRSNNHQVHLAALHEVAARVVGNDGVRDAMFAQFPRR